MTSSKIQLPVNIQNVSEQISNLHSKSTEKGRKRKFFSEEYSLSSWWIFECLLDHDSETTNKKYVISIGYIQLRVQLHVISITYRKPAFSIEYPFLWLSRWRNDPLWRKIFEYNSLLILALRERFGILAFYYHSSRHSPLNYISLLENNRIYGMRWFSGQVIMSFGIFSNTHESYILWYTVKTRT